MKYTLHSEPQGSDEWKAGRNSRLNASELVLAAGDGMNGRTRTDLIRKMATGIEPEVDAFTQKLYDEGHRFEALARPIAEQIIGRELYPITASIAVGGLSRRMGASLDGATDDDSDNFEHKRMNAELRAALAQGIIPVGYHWQMEQGQTINGATRTLFMASEWEKAPGEEADEGKVYGFAQDENGYEVRYALIEEMHVWYESNPVLRDRIIPIWKQAEADAENYQHVEVIPAAVAAPQMALPAVSIQVEGSIALRDNLDAFEVAMRAYIGGLNRKPQTDQDFADLDASAKLLREVQVKIAAARDGAIGQVASIDSMKRTADTLEELARVTAIEVENLVKAEKTNRRAAILQGGMTAFTEYVAALNTRLGKPYMPQIVADFAAAIKGKSKLDNIKDAVDTLLAQKKIEADGIADRIEANLNYLRENAKEYPFLFADAGQIVLKANDDFEALAKLRISEHKEAEAKKLEAIKEAARVEAEANAAAKVKAEADAKAKADADQAEAKRKADEEAAAPIVAAVPDYMAGERSREPQPGMMGYNDGTKRETRDHAAQPAAIAVTQAIPPAPVVAAAPDNGRYIRLGELNALLEFDASTEFLAKLGFAATKEKNARLYRECDVPAICQAIIEHVAGVPARMRRAA